MKITINTTAKGVEVSNYLLRMACDQIEEKPELLKVLNISKTDLEHAKKYRNALVKGLIQSSNRQIK